MEQSIEIGKVYENKSVNFCINLVTGFHVGVYGEGVNFTEINSRTGEVRNLFCNLDYFSSTYKELLNGIAVKKEFNKAERNGYNKGYADGYKVCDEERADSFKSGYNQGCIDANEGFELRKGVLNTEYVKGKTDGYSEGYQHGFDLGYSKAIEEIKSSNTGIGHLLGEEWDKGYNEAIKEMSESEELGETTEYVFGTEDCCEHHSPNKETQEAMQEVLDNPFIIKPSDLFKRKYSKEDDKHKYPHYFKDVSDLKWLDVYQVCKLFPVEDDSGAISHARKKLLVCGGRGGGKDKIKDIKEARDTLNRYLEIEGEQDD